MRGFLRAGLLALLCVAGFAGSALAQPAPVPPPRFEPAPPPPPGARHVWQPGHWRWTGAGWVWIGGHYVVRHHRWHQYVPGHWARRGPQWVWIPAHWR